MEITCPQCQFARTIADEKIPPRAEIATCPKCKHKFRFRNLEASATSEDVAVEEHQSTTPNTAAPQTKPPSSPDPAGKSPAGQEPREGEDFWDKLASLGQPHQEKTLTDSRAEAPPGIDPEIEVPWERLDKYGFFSGIWETIKRAMLQPAAFFQSMPLGNGQIKPLIFYLLIAEFQIVMQILWDMTGVGADATAEAGVVGISVVALLVVYPLLLTALLYLMALLVHACLNLVGVITRGFEGTFRALTYGSAPMVLVLIPLIGPLVGAIWSLVVTFLGYKHIHRTTTGRVIMAMLLPLIPFGLVLIMVLTLAQRNAAIPAF